MSYTRLNSADHDCATHRNRSLLCVHCGELICPLCGDPVICTQAIRTAHRTCDNHPEKPRPEDLPPNQKQEYRHVRTLIKIIPWKPANDEHLWGFTEYREFRQKLAEIYRELRKVKNANRTLPAL